MAQKSNTMKDPAFASFPVDSLIQNMEGSWLPFFQGEKVLTGIYKLKAGAKDKQEPHKTDEVYYVVSGRSKFKAGEELSEVTPGSILFVKAQVPHHFFDIEEDLVMVVFFDR